MKSLMIGGVGSIYLIASCTNYLDYNSNLEWLQRVLMMEETFKGEAVMWRAIRSELLQKIIYNLILLWEFLVGAVCSLTSLFGLIYYKQHQRFEKILTVGKWAVFGAFALHGYTFYAIGNEWFLGWQAPDLETKSAPLSFIVITGFTLLFICLVDAHNRTYEIKKNN